MKRTYGLRELNALREEQEIKTIYGTDIIVRKIPFETRKGIMDPRWMMFKYSDKKSESGMVPPAFPPEWLSLPNDELLAKIQAGMAAVLSKKDERVKDGDFNAECVWDEVAFPERTVGFYRYEASGRGKTNRPCVIMLHGGGWFMGKPLKNDSALLFLAERTNAVVYDVDYALAPQNKYPAALTDCWNLLRYVYENAEFLGIDKHRIVIAGSSAGGNLSAALALKDRDEKTNMLAMQILMVPVLLLAPGREIEGYNASANDFETSEEVEKLIGKIEPMENSIALRLMVKGYIETYPDDAFTSYLSPLCEKDLQGLPKTLVMTASLDSLWPQGVFYVKRLRDAGVDVKAIRYEGIEHETSGEFGVTPQIEDLYMEISDAINAL